MQPRFFQITGAEKRIRLSQGASLSGQIRARRSLPSVREGHSVAYEPIHAARRTGKSHIRLLRDGLRFLLIIFKIGTLYSLLKLFLPFPILLFLLATGWYLRTYIEQSRFTNMSALIYTGSSIVFLMGLISEQITGLMYKDSGERGE